MIRWPCVDVKKIILGTAQFGADGYQCSDEPVEILARALDLGIGRFDTSPAYGGAEALLQSFLGPERFRESVQTKIASKFSPPDGDGYATPPCRLILAHGWTGSMDRHSRDRAARTLEARLARGESVGCCAYDSDEVISFHRAGSWGWESMVVQIPLNVRDPRNLPLARMLHSLGCKVQIRSALAMHWPDPGVGIRLCRPDSRHVVEAMLGFVAKAAPFADVVVGAESVADLIEVAEVWDGLG